ncbi:MAG: hypothetical protein EAZ77_03595 [Nostocales cyanobacterium]|nr:MAG: hypothetical protein EAZ77_03595 [Nostocales cyanobacterium]
MLNIVNTSNLSPITDAVSQSLQNTKNFVTDTTGKTVNTFTEVTNKSLINFSETAEKANQSFTETVQSVATTVSDSTGKAVNKITETATNVTRTATQVKDALTTTTSTAIDHTIDSIAETAKQAENSVLQTFANTKTTLENTLQKAENVTNAASTAMENASNNFLNHQWDAMTTWINDHPTISWVMKSLLLAINHPIISIVIIFLSLYLVWKIFQLFSRILDQGLLFTFKTPIKLIYALFHLCFKTISKLLFSWLKIKPTAENNLELNAAISDASDTKQEITKLLHRLDAIRKEENDILKNLIALLAANQ